MSIRSHYAAGYGLGLLWRFAPRSRSEAQAMKLDQWAWKREERQNLAGENPNHPMSVHQQQEARAWGEGFRKAARLV